MPPVIIAAGIGAAASIGGAVMSSNASKRAVDAQREASNANNALSREQYAKNEANLSPFIHRGNNAGGYIGDLLNINGGDASKSQEAFGRFRDSTGFQFQLNEGLGAVNSNAYARGMGDSGATLKALQERGDNLARGSFNDYIGQLTGVQNAGVNAGSSLAGAGQAMVGQVSGNNQALATATGEGAMASASAWSNALRNVAGAASAGIGSSYKPNVPTGGGGMGGYMPGYTPSPYGYFPGGYGRSA